VAAAELITGDELVQQPASLDVAGGDVVTVYA